MNETKQGSSGGQSWTLSALSLLLVVTTATWTYVAWVSNSNILDYRRLQIFLTHHGDIATSLALYAAGISTILLMHEFGHLIVAKDSFRGPPLWLPAPGLYIPSLGGIQVTQKPVPLASPALHALMGPLWGILASTGCLTLGGLVLVDTPYLLEIDTQAQPLLIHALNTLGLTEQLNALQVAGWMGLLLSSMQLIPIGATDGGQLIHSISPRFHLISSLLSLTLLVLFAFSLPFREGFTWWIWAAFSALHLLGTPVFASSTASSWRQRGTLAILWLLLLASTSISTLNALPSAMIPEANISREVEL